MQSSRRIGHHTWRRSGATLCSDAWDDSLYVPRSPLTTLPPCMGHCSRPSLSRIFYVEESQNPILRSCCNSKPTPPRLVSVSRKLDLSHSLQQRAETFFPGGVNSPVRAFRAVGGEPPIIVSGAGARMTDADGNRYIDYVLSWGPLMLGHCAPAGRRGRHRSRPQGHQLRSLYTFRGRPRRSRSSRHFPRWKRCASSPAAPRPRCRPSASLEPQPTASTS